MKRSHFLPWVALVGCVACSRAADKNATDEVGTTTITQATVVVGPGDTDQQVTRRVEATFAADPFVSRAARNVEVTVTDGIVTLTGSVDGIPTKWTLEAAARKVNGVETVLDKTRVAPEENTLERADDQIAFDLQRSLIHDPSIAHDGETVTIDVLRGVVHLRGTTSDDVTRRAIERIVEETPGVVDVKNQLAVR